MNETEIEKKLDYAVHICKENYRLCKALLDCIVNQSVATDKRFKDIEIRIESLQKDMQEYDRLRTESNYRYTDSELAKLKQTMSWKQLHTKTKIPISTLQYKCRRYNKNLTSEKKRRLDYAETEYERKNAQ